jgi:ADP-ribosylglycohydrolase
VPPAALRSKITHRSNESFLGTVINGKIIIPWSKGFSWKGPTEQ